MKKIIGMSRELQKTGLHSERRIDAATDDGQSLRWQCRKGTAADLERSVTLESCSCHVMKFHSVVVK